MPFLLDNKNNTAFGPQKSAYMWDIFILTLKYNMADYTPIVIRQQDSGQVWVKAIAVVAIIAALVFAWLWACGSSSNQVEEEPTKNKSGKTMRNANKNKRVEPPPREDEDSEDDLIIDPDLQGGGNRIPPFTAPNPMMPGMAHDMPPIGSTGNFPMDMMSGGPPPPIKVGRGNDQDGGHGGYGGGGGDGGPRAYGGRRRKGVSIRL